MLKSLYSGVSGMKAFQIKLDVIGNNVANANTYGYKKSRVVFQDVLSQNISGATGPSDTNGGVNSKQIGLGVKVGSIDVVHTPGSPSSTGYGTDLMLEGDAFFAVSPDPDGGSIYLTRAGNFQRSADEEGYLIDSNGYFVLDEGGAKISIPHDEYDSFSIGTDGKITGTKDGAVVEGEKVIGTVVVPNPGGLKKVGSTMFEVTANSGIDDISDAIKSLADNNGGTIQTGLLEMSNVDLTEEFTEMIIAQRGFQANARTITTSDSMLEEVVNLKR